MKSRVGTAFLVAGAAVFLCACASPDGESRDSSGVPKGKTPVSQMSEEDWNDRDELARTWNAAKVRIPRATGLVKATMANLTVAPGEKYPLVIYMHGCNGFWGGTDRRVDFLAALGFASIAPDSFAREKVPTSCDPRAHRAGMYRGTLRMRQYEAAHAIERARELPWVDRDNIFLMGLSQGGITAATLEETGRPVNARVIEGWGCHAGWLEYKGLNAAPRQPVLSLVAARDPWFRADYLRGDCGAFMLNPEASGSKSVVFDSSRHELLELSEARDMVKAFLARHRN